MPDVTTTGSAAPNVLLVGLCTVDLVQRVPANPRIGEKAQSTSAETAAGGPASHAAVAVSALGGRATLLTALGAHPLAELARSDLAEHGVHVWDAAPERTDPPTVSAVTVRESDSERTIVSHNAAGMESRPPDDVQRAVQEADAVLLDGHHPDLTRAVAGAADRAGVPVVLDAGSYKPVLEDVLPMIDVCACSAGFRLPGFDERRDTDDALLARGVATITRTAGDGPVYWKHRVADGTIHDGEVGAVAVDARDTLAAGDVWHGALAHGVGRLGAAPEASHLPGLIADANEVAAVRVSHVGTRSWFAPLREPAR